MNDAQTIERRKREKGRKVGMLAGVLGVVPNARTPLKKEGWKGGRIPSCFQGQISGS